MFIKMIRVKWVSRFFIFTFSLLFMACKSRSVEKPDDKLYEASFTGYDISGDPHLCYQELELDQCGPAEDRNQQFIDECVEKEYLIYRCGCQKFLCSYNIWQKKE